MIFDPGTEKSKKIKKIKNLNFKYFKVINITREPLPRDWVKAGYMDRKFIYKYTILGMTGDRKGTKYESWYGANNIKQLKEHFKRI